VAAASRAGRRPAAARTRPRSRPWCPLHVPDDAAAQPADQPERAEPEQVQALAARDRAAEQAIGEHAGQVKHRGQQVGLHPLSLLPAICPHPSAPDDHWLSGFPRRTFLELGAYREAAGSARGHARNVLAELGLGAFADAVTLVVSEMIANSVIATEKVPWDAGVPHTPSVRLWMLGVPGTGGAGEVLLVVWDAVAEVPEMREAAAEDESGRGLGIVHWLSGRQWDCYLPPDPLAGRSQGRSSTARGATTRRSKAAIIVEHFTVVEYLPRDSEESIPRWQILPPLSRRRQG
jgi:hypothetical protein